MKTIELLRKQTNAAIVSLLKINDSTADDVTNEYYKATVFDTFEKYQRMIPILENKIIGSQQQAMVNTSLITERGNQSKIYNSNKNKGIGFGFILIDYITKQPLLVVVIDKGADKAYSYKSAAFNKKLNDWEDSLTITKNAETTDELISFCIEQFKADVEKF